MFLPKKAHPLKNEALASLHLPKAGGLQGMQDPLTQERKCCPTEHHALDEFKLVHFSLD
jgi:hypothetical protein